MLAEDAADAEESERERSITVAGVVRGVVQADSNTVELSSTNMSCAGTVLRFNGVFQNGFGFFILPLIVKAQKRPRLGPCADSGGS